MKILLISLCIFLLIIGAAIGYQYYLENILNQYIGLAEQMEQYVEAEDYRAAEEAFQLLKEQWDKHETGLSLCIEHDEADTVPALFAELEACFAHNVFHSYFQNSYKLKFQLEHLIKKNKLNPATIL